MGLKAPRGAVETLAGSGEEFVFPPGNYEAVLEEVREREIPTNAQGEPFAGFVTADGTVLGLQFGSITPIDVDVEIGDRKYFMDITLRDGERTIEDVDVENRDEPAWQLQRSARRLVNLFLAMGPVNENSDGTIEVPDEAIAELEAGALNGARVGFTIVNRKESAKRFRERKVEDPSAERRVFDEISSFFATV